MDFGTGVRENLRTALLTGNFDDIGAALVQSLQAALIDSILGSLFSALGSAFPALGGGFAEGGMVPGPPGAPRLILAHGGEEVLTEDQQRGGGRGSIVIQQQFNGGLTAQQRQEVASMGRELAGSVRAEFAEQRIAGFA